jgi:hypothetical protein
MLEARNSYLEGQIKMATQLIISRIPQQSDDIIQRRNEVFARVLARLQEEEEEDIG